MREDRVFRGELQGFDEAFAQTLAEIERTAEEHDAAFDLSTLCETGDGLVDDRLIDAGGNVGFGCTLIEQGLDVGLCEHTAAGSDRIEFLMLQGEFVEFVGSDVEKGRHLVDERARTAGTGAVHAFVAAAVEENDLCVLAAEFDDGGGVGLDLTDNFPGRPDFLDEGDARRVGESETRGTGERGGEGFSADNFSGFAHESGEGLADLCEVTDVAFEEELALFHHGDLRGGGADIKPHGDAGRSRGIMFIKCAVCQSSHRPL